MSYIRWGYEGSSVYVYLDCGGFLLCTGCGEGLGFKAYQTADMIGHLKQHQVKGDIVPQSAFDSLLRDASENDEWMEKVKHGFASG